MHAHFRCHFFESSGWLVLGVKLSEIVEVVALALIDSVRDQLNFGLHLDISESKSQISLQSCSRDSYSYLFHLNK